MFDHSSNPAPASVSRHPVFAKTMDLFHTFVMPGRWHTQLFEIATSQYGYVTTDDVRKLGGTPQVLIDMHRHGHLDHVSHGLYRFQAFPHGQLDEFMQAVLWPRGLGVVSHDSALDLWDLSDVNPAKIHVTVPKSARIRRATPGTYYVHTRDLEPSDVTWLDGIRVVDPRRAILDGIERHLDRRLIGQAVEAARQRGLVDNETLNALERSVR